MVRATVTEVRTEHGWLETKVEAVEAELKSHQGELRALQDDLLDLKKQQSAQHVAGPESDDLDLNVSARKQSDRPRGAAGVSRADVQNMILEERRQEMNRTNIILSGVPEAESEDLATPLSVLFPDVKLATLSATRVGKKQPDSCRLIRIQTTASCKKLIMKRKKNGLKYGGQDVYINHDLTPKQREARRKVVPTFKQLRQRNVQCSLPVDRILIDGKPVSEAQIAELLGDVAALNGCTQ